MIDIAKLKALHGALEQDHAALAHRAHDQLSIFLWQNIPQILDMADRLTRYEAALREIVACERIWMAPDRAKAALGDTQ